MSEMKEAALEALEMERGEDMNYCHYSMIDAATTEIDTLAERDAELEKLWAELADVPFDDGDPLKHDMVLAETWRQFKAGTSREDIWHWFDERHSKGVYYLLHGAEIDEDKVKKLLKLADLCDDCESDWCAYNADGVCRYALVRGMKPEWSDHHGCLSCVAKG